ncbi:MAG: hypothetical protein EOO41_03590 [Methanobacteriota archaeon]|nr:MAG: hypothetical protein EOO41_03590 [Euryarchaeota archaeon]
MAIDATRGQRQAATRQRVPQAAGGSASMSAASSTVRPPALPVPTRPTVSQTHTPLPSPHALSDDVLVDMLTGALQVSASVPPHEHGQRSDADRASSRSLTESARLHAVEEADATFQQATRHVQRMLSRVRIPQPKRVAALARSPRSNTLTSASPTSLSDALPQWSTHFDALYADAVLALPQLLVAAALKNVDDAPAEAPAGAPTASASFAHSASPAAASKETNMLDRLDFDDEVAGAGARCGARGRTVGGVDVDASLARELEAAHRAAAQRRLITQHARQLAVANAIMSALQDMLTDADVVSMVRESAAAKLRDVLVRETM